MTDVDYHRKVDSLVDIEQSPFTDALRLLPLKVTVDE